MKTSLNTAPIFTFMLSAFTGLSLLCVGTAPDARADTADFGGAGVKIYYGTNSKAWIYRDCKIVIAGTANTPITQIQISDSANTYLFWSYSPSIVMQAGPAEGSLHISDNMHFKTKHGERALYTNTFPEGEGRATLALRNSAATGKLELAELTYFHGDGVENTISCSRLTQR